MTSLAPPFPRQPLASLFLLLAWFLSFSTQGAVYQFSIYLLPFILLGNHSTRKQFVALLKREWMLIAIVSIPVATAFGIHIIKSPDAGLSGKIIKDGDMLLEYYWRFIVFAAAMAIALINAQLSHRSLFVLLYIAALFHLVAAVVIHNNAFTQLFQPVAHMPRWHGLIDSPNEFGVLMSIGAISATAISAWLSAGYNRLLVSLSVLLFIPPVLASHSRTAWLVLLVGFLSLLAYRIYQSRWQNTRNLAVLIALVLGLTTIAFVFYEPLSARAVKLFTDPYRTSIWTHFFKVWQEQPVFGIYSITGAGYLHPVNQYLYVNPHSVILDIAVRTGLLGLLGFFIYLAIVGYRIIHSRYSAEFTALLLAVFTSGLFNFSIFAKTFTQSLFTILLAFAFIWTLQKPPGRQDGNMPGNSTVRQKA